MHATFEGRSVLVTGASRGFGRSIAVAFARAGADVGVNFRAEASKAAETAKLVEAEGRRAVVLQGDVADAGAVRSVFDAFEVAFGAPPDILVNNAGVNKAKPFLEIPPEDFDLIMDVNAKGVFLASQELGRRVFATKSRAPRAPTSASEIRPAGPAASAVDPARIVNLASAAGIQARPGSVHYGAAKAAVIAITKSTAEALAPHVVVNALAPGFFDNEFNRYVAQDVRRAIEHQVPLKRWGDPEEVAKAVLLLAAMPSYVTGQTLAIDGGITNVYFSPPEPVG